MTFKVLVSDKLSKEGLKVLQATKGLTADYKPGLSPHELKKAIGSYHALVIRSGTKVTKEVLQAAGDLRVVGRAGVGVDNVDLKEATKRGVVVMNTPDGNTISTAEHTVSMILAMARNIPQAHASLKGGKWERGKFMGTELYSKTVGIVGLGRIGMQVAKRLLSFGMKIIAYDPYIEPEHAAALKIKLVKLTDLFKNADYITVHTPKTNKTKHLISGKEIAMMKKGVRIINCARGGIIDEAALYRGLKSGKVAGAALDVYEKEPPLDSPLLKLDNVVVVPHLGASTAEAQENVAVVVAGQVIDALLKDTVRNAVNVPAVSLEDLKVLEPYFRLAEAMGSIIAQLIDGNINRLRVEYSGEQLPGTNTKAVTVALLKGVLEHATPERVNYVNAEYLARERGIEVIESTGAGSKDYQNMVYVKVRSPKDSRTISGTVLGGDKIRIIQLNGYETDVAPSKLMLIFNHLDKPGTVGKIGTILGAAKVNIASMNLGRKQSGGKAIAIMNIDNPAKEKTLEELRKLPQIAELKQVRIG